MECEMAEPEERGSVAGTDEKSVPVVESIDWRLRLR